MHQDLGGPSRLSLGRLMNKSTDRRLIPAPNTSPGLKWAVFDMEVLVLQWR